MKLTIELTEHYPNRSNLDRGKKAATTRHAERALY